VTPTIPSTRRQQIVEAARRLLEEQGPAALSMRNVAAEIGIRAPSLYEHVTDKRALESAIIADALTEHGLAQSQAIEDGHSDDPLMDMAMRYREWALTHPHLYRLIYSRDLDRDEPAVAEAERVAAIPIRTLTAGDVPAARVIWSFAHGMVSLELADRFPPDTDVDELWQRGMAALKGTLMAQPAGERANGGARRL
jgi:AcrR family transcriptional regulator